MLGYGASNDAHHMAQPEPEATGVAAMMRGALERAGVDPERVGYINAHGTSTPLGDAAETRAIKDVFGDHAYDLAVSSTKSMTGHTFGAAGAIEAIMCVLALHDGVLPPTINYREPDPDCDLDYVPERGARGAGRRRALERDGPRRAQRLRAARRAADVRLTLVRHATLLLETSRGRMLVDPMLRAAGTTPPIENTPNQVREPARRAADAEARSCAGVDALHRHAPAQRPLRRRRGRVAAARPADPDPARERRRARARAASRTSPTTHAGESPMTRGRHGTGEIGEALGPVSGWVVDGVYVAGDTIWCDEVTTPRAHRPRRDRRERAAARASTTATRS